MSICLTDNGFNLAFSRRILEGQVIHRDFINMRPIGTPLLHIPFVYFGGDYTFWVSRLFVWFEFACIAWIWTTVIIQVLKISVPVVQKILLASLAFMLTTPIFVGMIFYTIDGLFFLSLGLVLCLEETPRRKLLGYALMGLAYLCKQSFLPAVLAFPFILGDWRRARLWLAAATPGILYTAYLLFAGAIPDAMIQLNLHTDKVFSLGVKTYLHAYPMPWGILLGYFAMVLSFGQMKIAGLEKRTDLQRSLGTLALFAAPLSFSILLALNIHHAVLRLSFGLFGTVLGATCYSILEKKRQADLMQAGLLVLFMAWSASLSLGYNLPAPAAGPLSVLLVAYSYRAYRSTNENIGLKKLPLYLLSVLFIVSLFSYGISKQKYIWKDRPAAELTQALDGVLPGGRLIRTNPNTYGFLVDFKEAVEKTKGLDFTVIPGIPAYWVKSLRKNPLPIDWIFIRNELANKRPLIDRILRDLDKYHGKIVVLLQKVAADNIANGFVPLKDDEIQQYVRTHFTKTDETKFFELYQ